MGASWLRLARIVVLTLAMIAAAADPAGMQYDHRHAERESAAPAAK